MAVDFSPEDQAAAEQLASVLEAEFKKDLISVYLYKSPRVKAKVTALVVFRYIQLSMLDRFDDVVKQAKISRIKIQLRTREEFMSSGDIFPDFYLELKSHYVLIWGRDDLQRVQVDDVHLRLFLEYDLRNLAFRYRRIYLKNRGNSVALKKLVRATRFEVLRIFRYLMYLEGGLNTIAASLHDLQTLVDKHPDFEEGLFHKILTLTMQEEKLIEEADLMLNVLMRLEAYTDKLRV